MRQRRRYRAWAPRSDGRPRTASRLATAYGASDMTKNILMPVVVAGMTEGALARWTKSEGDVVRKGEVIAEVESDKAVVEIEAECDGALGRIVVPSGTQPVPAQSVIGVLLEPNETSAALPQPATTSAKALTSEQTATSAKPILTPASLDRPAPISRTNLASPLARRLAAQWGVSLETIHGSGPHGRIVKLDIERALDAPRISPQAATSAGAGPGGTTSESRIRRLAVLSQGACPG